MKKKEAVDLARRAYNLGILEGSLRMLGSNSGRPNDNFEDTPLKDLAESYFFLDGTATLALCAVVAMLGLLALIVLL